MSAGRCFVFLCVAAVVVAFAIGCSRSSRESGTQSDLKDANLPSYMDIESTTLDRNAAKVARKKATEAEARASQRAPVADEPGPKFEVDLSGAPVVDVAALRDQPGNPENPGLRIEMAGNREIIIELFADKSPRTVEHFVKQVKAGFHNGLFFHRSDEMCIQGGDATKVGKAPWPETVDLENSGIAFMRGSVGMARTQDPNSASSQFYICKIAAQHLNNQYANFGKVLKGMDVVDSIPARANDADVRSVPLAQEAKVVKMELVRFSGGEETTESTES